MDNALNAGIPSGEENVERAGDVGGNDLLGMMVRVRDRSEGPEVKDGIAAANSLSVRIFHISEVV